MYKAVVPQDEDERVAALKSYSVLDSALESEYDSITKIAAEMFGTPIALISFVDSDRQWFKSHYGLSVRETPRDYAFCAHAILQDKVFVVDDTLNDRRFSDNPLVVSSPYVRFYAGAPLRTPQGHKLGTLCVIDEVPRSFSDREVEMLAELSQQVVSLLELRRVTRQSGERERFLQTILEAQPGVATWEWDVAQNLVRWDENQYQLYEIDRREFKSDYDAFVHTIHPEDRPAVLGAINACLYGGAAYNQSYRVILQSGSIRYVRSSASISRDDNGVALRMLGVTWDVTQHHQDEMVIEQQRATISQSMKMASLGEMAAGVAHEINNPLSIINGKCMVLQRYIAAGTVPTDVLSADLKVMSNMVNRISKIIRGLKTFSRSAEKDPMEIIKVVTVVEETLDLCRERFRYNGVEIREDIDTALTMECRPTQVSQVLMNLFSNAFDAIKTFEDKWLAVMVREVDGFAEISVTDCGNGIPQSVVDRIMEPFFTTKQAGEGTGLGLSIALGIVQEHNGTFQYDGSSENTKFIVRFPIRQPQKVQKVA